MLTTTGHELYAEMDRNEGGAKTHPDGDVEATLSEALRATLDNIAVGVIIVGGDSRILHANQTARRMLNARSPIVSLGGRVGALRADLTDELRQALAQVIQSPHCKSGISLPLVNRDMTAATAHVVPLSLRDAPCGFATIFVASASSSSSVDLSTVGRIFRLTPAESRLLKYLVAGTTITEAAAALAVSEATARTHQSHIYSKLGVSRWTDLMILIGRLLPPICRARVS